MSEEGTGESVRADDFTAESVYRSSPLVANLCLYADANARQPIAIVVAHEINVLRFVKDRSLTSSKEIHDICADPKVRTAALVEINAVGKKAGLANMELLQAVVLVADEWTPESGLVTAAQKLQRKPIEKKFADDIKVRSLLARWIPLFDELTLSLFSLRAEGLRLNRIPQAIFGHSLTYQYSLRASPARLSFCFHHPFVLLPTLSLLFND